MAPKYRTIGFNKEPEPNFHVDHYVIKIADIDYNALVNHNVNVVGIHEVDIEKVLQFENSVVPFIERDEYVKNSLVGSKNQIVKVRLLNTFIVW